MKPVSLAVVLFPGLPSFSLSCSSLQHVGPALGPDVSIETSSVSKRSLNISSVRSTNAVSLCRVVGSLKYGSRRNNTLRFEVWLPEAKSYNGRYLSVGNGGFAGTIDYATMLANLNAGYAVGGCDSGHPASANGESQPGSFVPYLNDRDKTRAWIHDSIAMFTAPAKQLTTAFYRRPPKKSYYYGCSTGGAQGFALAQLHPDVFDGIYAGCPGNYYSHLILSFLWNGLNSNSPGAFLPQSALDLITSAIRSQCGAVDGVVADPAKCDFNVTSLLCMPDQNPTPANSTTVCLTAAQVANAKKFYAGPKDVRTGTQVYPGFAFGSEIEWMHQQTTLYLAYGVPILQNLVFKNLSYDHTTFNWGSDVAEVDRTAGVLIDEISPDLRPFKARGGKMIVTQGWADPYNSPFWPIQQRAEMANIFGDELSSFFSLFMIPGGGHCGAASGYDQVPATYHVLDRLVTWVEEGQQPQDLLTTDPPDGSGRSKLLYPYE